MCALTTEEEFDFRDLDRFDAANVPVLSRSVRAFHRAHRAPLSDLSVRRACDEEIATILSPYRPDLLFFSSYLYIATTALLDLTGRQAVNIHGSDLNLVGEDGRPRYTGLRAVADAILCGEPETRATAHWATEEVDVGPVIVRSRSFPVAPFVPSLLARGDRKAVRAYAYAHQEWMLQDAWGPLWQSVLRLVIAGRTAPESRLPVETPASTARSSLTEARVLSRGKRP